MAKKIKLDLTNKALTAILQVALDSAIKQKEAAMEHHDDISRSFHIAEHVDAGTAMAIKEISESLEKYLKSANVSLDNIIKIARLVSEVILRRQQQEDTPMTDEEKQAMQKQINDFMIKATDAKGED